VNEGLPPDLVDPEQIEDIVNMLNDLGIPVYEHAPALATVSSEPMKHYDDSLWATALEEYESQTRRPGLFARLFAEANGDEAKTKAAYLRERVKELSLEGSRRRP
jgi:RNA polymerase primary sigma factor